MCQYCFYFVSYQVYAPTSGVVHVIDVLNSGELLEQEDGIGKLLMASQIRKVSINTQY